MAERKPFKDMTLDELRDTIRVVKEEGRKIQLHYKRLEQEYSDWEDRVRDIEEAIAQAEEDTGITKEEIYNGASSDEFTDMLGEEEDETIDEDFYSDSLDDT